MRITVHALLVFGVLVVAGFIYVIVMQGSGDKPVSGSKAQATDEADIERFPWVLEERVGPNQWREVTDGPSRFPKRLICQERGHRWRERLMKRGVIPRVFRCRDLRDKLR